MHPMTTSYLDRQPEVAISRSGGRLLRYATAHGEIDVSGDALDCAVAALGSGDDDSPLARLAGGDRSARTLFAVEAGMDHHTPTDASVTLTVICEHLRDGCIETGPEKAREIYAKVAGLYKYSIADDWQSFEAPEVPMQNAWQTLWSTARKLAPAMAPTDILLVGDVIADAASADLDMARTCIARLPGNRIEGEASRLLRMVETLQALGLDVGHAPEAVRLARDHINAGTCQIEDITALGDALSLPLQGDRSAAAVGALLFVVADGWATDYSIAADKMAAALRIAADAFEGA